MRKRKSIFFIGLFTLFFIAGFEVVELLMATGVLPQHFSVNTLLCFVLIPIVFVQIYCWGSVSIRTSFSKGGTSCLIALVVDIVVCLFLWIPVAGPLLTIAASVIFGLVALGLALSGFLGWNKTRIAFGIQSLTALYCGLNYIYILLLTEGGMGGEMITAFWSMILLPVICVLIIADMVIVRKYARYSGELSVNDLSRKPS